MYGSSIVPEALEEFSEKQSSDKRAETGINASEFHAAIGSAKIMEKSGELRRNVSRINRVGLCKSSLGRGVRMIIARV